MSAGRPRGDHHVRAVIETTPCRDDMSGEAFPARVRVERDGRRLAGCGRPLGAGTRTPASVSSP